MPRSTAQKLNIHPGFTLLTLHAPKDFKSKLQPMPDQVNITDAANKYEQVHWFISNKAQLEKELDKVLPLIKADTTCWVYYPKGSSKMQTDLTRDKGWESLLNHDELTWISLISFDETWSVFGFRHKTEKDRKKDAQPKVREIFNYIDARTKTIHLPEDLASAMSKHKKAVAFFNTLSFTNKKEYVEWVVTAKRAETRTQRISETMEKLEKGWKNPRNL